jgi:hypothetical protein
MRGDVAYNGYNTSDNPRSSVAFGSYMLRFLVFSSSTSECWARSASSHGLHSLSDLLVNLEERKRTRRQFYYSRIASDPKRNE